MDGVCRRQLMDANINDLFRFASQYRPQQVGIEVSGQQGGFIQWILSEMMNRNIYFTLASENNSSHPGIRPNTNKMVRFNIVVPWFKAGKMYFPLEKKGSPEMAECMSELSLASANGFRSKQDDFIDNISMLGSLTPWKPTEDLEMSQSANKMWDFGDDDSPVDQLASYIV